MPVPRERDVGVGGSEVLADRDDVDAHGAKIFERRDDLVELLSYSDDDAGLRRESSRLRTAENCEAARVGGRGTDRALESEHCLDVVIDDVRPRREERLER